MVQRKGGVAGWLARVPDLVKGWPEAISGPKGERLSVVYGQHDLHGRAYVSLCGDMERADGRMVPNEFELAPGVFVALEDCRIFL